MYEAVVNDVNRWMWPAVVAAGKEPPKIAGRRRPDAVLLKPWVDAAVTAVELWISDESNGSAITVLAYGDVPALADEVRRRVRYRLGTIFGADLREWVDEPHW